MTIALWPELARTSPAPGLSVALTGSNLLTLTITNGVTNEYYEIYSKIQLEAPDWSFFTGGTLGQTSFSTFTYPAQQRFYRARATNDWDGDGILNWQDADPNSTNVGLLTITIENPANGALLNN
jgi:hypothetical protein